MLRREHTFPAVFHLPISSENLQDLQNHENQYNGGCDAADEKQDGLHSPALTKQDGLFHDFLAVLMEYPGGFFHFGQFHFKGFLNTAADGLAQGRSQPLDFLIDSGT